MTTKPRAEKKAKNPNLYSKSKLAVRFQIDRPTVSKRLLRAGIEPHPDSTDNEQLYELTKAVEIALRGGNSEKEEKTVKAIDLKNEKLQIELAALRGEYLPTKEVIDAIAAIFGTLHKKIVVQGVKDLVRKIRASKDAESANELAKNILNAPFMDARENHQEFLK